MRDLGNSPGNDRFWCVKWRACWNLVSLCAPRGTRTMEQYRLILYCARFFAGAALILFFLTSCTNYWLHAVTCRSVNDTLEDQSSSLTSSGVNHSEILNGNPHSTGTSTSLSGSGLVQYQKRSLQPKPRIFNRFKNTFLAMKDHRLNYHHEGFFWRCSFQDREEESQLRKFIYIYQPPLKCCIHAFHSPFPKVEGETTKEFQSSLFYRKLWSALMFLGVIFITIGFLCITYNACCQKYSMHKAIGVIFLMAGVSFTVSVIMYVCWISAVSQMIEGEIENCTSIATNVNFGVSYGWSFMAAPFAILFCFIASLLFIKLTGIEYKESRGII
ncbi:transmembrane protein 182-like [Pristis pectinata]|uniref:transmembrane protein 182-like n=1 Tax=Pristis pectinata TaxID=685728 RepID=UPI00223CA14F|nr:transmembrane protein 182-like [Pristis pectinata]